ncbi:MAG: IgGFc-binding protein, partial [Myxococcales bacterium]|nr:IgGFc-binding protein [Myxococcales bacterium]
NVIRILSGADGNTISFTPPDIGPLTLDRGRFVELEASTAFRVVGTEALLISQFLVGQDYAGISSSEAMGQGDPSMSLAIPTEQFRESYTILAPSSYESSFVNITASADQEVWIDGERVSAWVALAGTDRRIARLPVSAGVHHVESDFPFGIVVYGFGSYTSYMYPGGLDLRPINPLI